MNTTNLFVELIVIGAGAFLWMVLLALAVLGYSPAGLVAALKVPMMLAVLPLVYVLGILSDRLADRAFAGRDAALREEVFPGKLDDYYVKRRTILNRSERLTEQLEYGRSRLRICRGWAFNAPLVLLAFLLFVGLRIGRSGLPLALTGTALLLLLSLGCFWAWHSLSLTEYRKVDRQGAYLLELEAADGSG